MAGLGDGVKTPPRGSGAAFARRFFDKNRKMPIHENEWTTGGGALTSTPSSMMVTAGSNGIESAKTNNIIFFSLIYLSKTKKILSQTTGWRACTPKNARDDGRGITQTK